MWAALVFLTLSLVVAVLWGEAVWLVLETEQLEGCSAAGMDWRQAWESPAKEWRLSRLGLHQAGEQLISLLNLMCPCLCSDPPKVRRGKFCLIHNCGKELGSKHT